MELTITQYPNGADALHYEVEVPEFYRPNLARIIARGADSPYAPVFEAEVDLIDGIAFFERRADVDTLARLIMDHGTRPGTFTPSVPCPDEVEAAALTIMQGPEL